MLKLPNAAPPLPRIGLAVAAFQSPGGICRGCRALAGGFAGAARPRPPPFAVILVFGGVIVTLSLAVAPEAAKSSGLARLAVALSGLAVAGGVVYLAEKLFNTGKGVGQRALELVVERYKQHQLETGRKQGRAAAHANGADAG